MKYQFPLIKTIDDVLPHIKGRDEFIVAERDEYDVINYMVEMPETFAMNGPDDLSGAIRRECRGIMFDKSGKIISRPLHKFFNLGQKEETFPCNVSFGDVARIEEKLDGSMARPFYLNGKLRWGTKMGVTDGFTDRIEEFVAANPHLNREAERFLLQGKTPIFEWFGPDNRIVVHYEKEEMRLLAVRDMFTGEYDDSVDSLIGVRSYYVDGGQTLDRYVSEVREMKGIEGFILVFRNGHRVKLKTDEYVRIHKTKDELRYDFYIAQHIINQEIDDIKPFLDEADAKRVEEYEKKFWSLYDYHVKRIFDVAKRCEGHDRKTMATQILKNEDAWTKSIVFKFFDGKMIPDLVLDMFKRNTNGQTAHEKLMEWK